MDSGVRDALNQRTVRVFAPAPCEGPRLDRQLSPGSLQTLANRFGLAVTGGSDFHGGNKPQISLGTGLRGNLNVPDSVLDGLKALVKLQR